MKQILYILSLVLLLASCADDPSKKKTSTSKDTSTPKTEQKVEKSASVPFPPEQIEKAKNIIASVSEEDIAAVDAAAKFKMTCAICHGTKGNLSINGAKDLALSTLSLEERVAIIYHGRGLMTPNKTTLKEAEIVAIAKYIETQFRQVK